MVSDEDRRFEQAHVDAYVRFLIKHNPHLKFYGFTVDDTVNVLKSKQRKRYISRRRHELYHRLRKIGFKWRHIAEYFNKNHASCINGANTYQKRIAYEE